MRWVGYAFWGIVTGMNCLALLLLVTLYFGNTSVLYILWDTTSSVWYFAGGGAILGLSFGYSKSKRQVYKIRKPRDGRGAGYSPSEYQSDRLKSTGERG